jgi:hypothetical protein
VIDLHTFSLNFHHSITKNIAAETLKAEGLGSLINPSKATTRNSAESNTTKTLQAGL